MSRRLVRWSLTVLAIPFVLTAVGMAVGSVLPRDHVVASSGFFSAPPDTVWAVLTDFAHSPSWRPEIERMERIEDREGRAVWREVGRRTGVLTYEITRWDPPRLLALCIVDPDLPFGGTWEYALASERGGTRLTVTERGTIKNPLFRFLARFVIGYHSTLDGYLAQLGRRLGEEIRPAHLSPSTGE